jgi:hypothetical protein
LAEIARTTSLGMSRYDTRQTEQKASADLTRTAPDAFNRRSMRSAEVAQPRQPAFRSLVAQAVNSPGQPLDAGTRALIEPRFGQDFSRVRIHTGAAAAASAEAVNAAAYTTGQDVVFAPGQYAPGRAEGHWLLAHELAHVAQQREAGGSRPETVSQSGDAHEVAADRAAANVLGGGRYVPCGLGTPPAIQRQTPGRNQLSLGLPTLPMQQSQGEIALESFLNRMWDAQSKQGKPFRITPKVTEGLNIVFPLGAPIGPLTIYASVADFMKQLKGKIPPTIDPNALAVLDRLPTQEKPLPESTGGVTGEPAKPKLGLEGAGGASAKEPPKSGGATEAMQKALEAAFEEFRKTEVGKQLEQSVKSYVFSKEGIPLLVIVTGATLAFVAANDPSLPSPPDIPLGEGIKLGFEIKGKASDFPPLVRALVENQPGLGPSPAHGEVKAGVSVTFTFEALGKFAQAVGRFFAEAGKWFANGLVKAGTVIGKAVSSIKTELLAMAGGAALGALVGGLAGGPLGAAIGAAIGGVVGLGAALIRRLF